MLQLLLSGCMMDIGIGRSGPDEPLPTPVDLDQDGYSSDQGDCNDLEPRIGPGFAEACDGLDNDCDGTIDINADGLHECATQDRYPQYLRADVLLVVNTTPTMHRDDHLNPAADGAEVMLNYLMGPGFDTHIGVVTMDMVSADAGGQLVMLDQGPRIAWVTGEQSPQSARQWLGLTVSDHEPVVGVEAEARAAVHAAVFDHDEGRNAGFLRPEADLAVLFLTDQEDFSEPQNGDLLSALHKSKPAGSSVTFYALTLEGKRNCAGQETTPAASLRDLVDRTQGIRGDICSSDFDTFFADMGQAVANDALGDTFRLTQRAQLGGITVSIQEGLAPPYRWVGPFALDSDGQTLVFYENRPPPGSTVIVDYLHNY